jgi:hypothetical protein
MQTKSHQIPTGTFRNVIDNRLSSGTVGMTDRKGMAIPMV